MSITAASYGSAKALCSASWPSPSYSTTKPACVSPLQIKEAVRTSSSTIRTLILDLQQNEMTHPACSDTAHSASIGVCTQVICLNITKR